MCVPFIFNQTPCVFRLFSTKPHLCSGSVRGPVEQIYYNLLPENCGIQGNNREYGQNCWKGRAELSRAWVRDRGMTTRRKAPGPARFAAFLALFVTGFTSSGSPHHSPRSPTNPSPNHPATSPPLPQTPPPPSGNCCFVPQRGSLCVQNDAFLRPRAIVVRIYCHTHARTHAHTHHPHRRLPQRELVVFCPFETTIILSSYTSHHGIHQYGMPASAIISSKLSLSLSLSLSHISESLCLSRSSLSPGPSWQLPAHPCPSLKLNPELNPTTGPTASIKVSGRTPEVRP